jgi:hypothetical protein
MCFVFGHFFFWKMHKTALSTQHLQVVVPEKKKKKILTCWVATGVEPEAERGAYGQAESFPTRLKAFES